MKLKAPENSGTHISFDGHLYEVKDGIVEVPDHASELIHHGFAPATDADLNPKKETAAEKKAREAAEKAAAEAAAKAAANPGNGESASAAGADAGE